MKPISCTSGMTCVPGDGSELRGSDERWMIHLSAVQERGSGGERLNPCVTNREFWVCRAGVSVRGSIRRLLEYEPLLKQVEHLAAYATTYR